MHVCEPRRLEGQSCAYCYTSAALSALILLSTVPGWKTKDVGSGAHRLSVFPCRTQTPQHLGRHEDGLLQNTTAYIIQAQSTSSRFRWPSGAVECLFRPQRAALSLVRVAGDALFSSRG